MIVSTCPLSRLYINSIPSSSVTTPLSATISPNPPLRFPPDIAGTTRVGALVVSAMPSTERSHHNLAILKLVLKTQVSIHSRKMNLWKHEIIKQENNMLCSANTQCFFSLLWPAQCPLQSRGSLEIPHTSV